MLRNWNGWPWSWPKAPPPTQIEKVIDAGVTWEFWRNRVMFFVVGINLCLTKEKRKLMWASLPNILLSFIFCAPGYIVLGRRCTGLGHTENNLYRSFSKINGKMLQSKPFLPPCRQIVNTLSSQQTMQEMIACTTILLMLMMTVIPITLYFVQEHAWCNYEAMVHICYQVPVV